MQRPGETIDLDRIARLIDLPEPTVAEDLRSLRQSRPQRPLVDRGGILSAAIAFGLIASGLIVHKIYLHGGHVPHLIHLGFNR